MNKVTEKQIEDKLKNLASIEPSRASGQRMNDRVRQAISEAGTKSVRLRGFFYYAVASAAVLLIGIALLHHPHSIVVPDDPIRFASFEPSPTRAKLNAVFSQGGQKALDEYFKKIEQHRQPRAENITLNELMKEL